MAVQSFDPARTTPKGQWEKLYGWVSVRGEKYRIQNCRRFIEGVTALPEAVTDFGVTLEREPTNSADPLAIMVVGFWTEGGWFFKRRHTAHLGYMPRNMAYALTKRIAEGRSLAACLRSIEISGDEIDIVIDVLAS